MTLLGHVKGLIFFIYFFTILVIRCLHIHYLYLYYLKQNNLPWVNIKSEFLVSFLVFAVGKTERLEKYDPDLLQTRVIYQSHNPNRLTAE